MTNYIFVGGADHNLYTVTALAGTKIWTLTTGIVMDTLRLRSAATARWCTSGVTTTTSTPLLRWTAVQRIKMVRKTEHREGSDEEHVGLCWI